MKKSNIVTILSTSLILILILTGCNLPGTSQNLSIEDQVATYQKQTEDAMGSDSTGEGEETKTATETQQPSLTPSATITLTPTQDKPMVSVSVDTNCRKGPGQIYDWIGGLLVGEKAEVVGASTDGRYWIIKNPDRSGECWLWGNYATVTGSTSDLPRFTPPPTPTPAFSWTGNWTSYTTDTSNHLLDSYSMSITVDGKDFTAILDVGGGDTVTATGTISNDYLSVSGSWVGSGASGNFKFIAMGVNQFQGHADNGGSAFGWCGGRGGAGQPSPCYIP